MARSIGFRIGRRFGIAVSYRLPFFAMSEAVYRCCGNLIEHSPPLPPSDSAGRPRELAAAEQVEVEMVDGLAAIAAAVDDDSIAAIEFLFRSDLAYDEHHVSEQGGIRGIDGRQGRDRFLGDNEDVHRRLRRDVVKGEAKVVLMNDLCRDLLVDDTLKDRFVGHNRSASQLPVS